MLSSATRGKIDREGTRRRATSAAARSGGLLVVLIARGISWRRWERAGLWLYLCMAAAPPWRQHVVVIDVMRMLYKSRGAPPSGCMIPTAAESRRVSLAEGARDSSGGKGACGPHGAGEDSG